MTICGGDFEQVENRFKAWKQERPVYRSNPQKMFEGKQEVRRLSKRVMDNGEIAQNVLAQHCSPENPYALAVEVNDGERDVWLVMAAYSQ